MCLASVLMRGRRARRLFSGIRRPRDDEIDVMRGGFEGAGDRGVNAEMVKIN